MVSATRSLPEAHNPLLDPEHTPPLEILVERRRLGQTDLSVKHMQLGLVNAAKPENLGLFDYAHLRVPLPKDLNGSGIFSLQKTHTYPESYFLMRRSTDGYISATGMFKAAYPWATVEEEQVERKYHKELPSAGPEEIAGNVWISPEQALTLADEYRMRPWIVALLDSSPIEKGAKDKSATQISTPPKFVVPDKDKLFTGPRLDASTMRRRLRSASPSKAPSLAATPTQAARKIASPRKRGRPKKAPVSDTDENASSQLNGGDEVGVVVRPESSKPNPAEDDVVRVQVDETVQATGDVETTTTSVRVEMPASHPDLPLPETTEEMIARAREMVEEALVRPEKRARGGLVEQLRTERVKTRALIGLTATLGLGVIIPYFI
ncbi:hypothetical protein EJ06DRAFT_230819 [Trichodelitschia bisporula]|uniref:HTH APSES-type domain-containing protein n=1 Tax=Trichodelitschia bisporula TaxID=703511 RepID=A0A6G1HL32_9PEZI|nr:hypothetical protein EJ06DRAFT_230819 [Trichodelitschia bisporula]